MTVVKLVHLFAALNPSTYILVPSLDTSFNKKTQDDKSVATYQDSNIVFDKHTIIFLDVQNALWKVISMFQ